MTLHELLEEANRIEASMIVVGSQGLLQMQRMLLTCLGHGTATRADMSVEIVH